MQIFNLHTAYTNILFWIYQNEITHFHILSSIYKTNKQNCNGDITSTLTIKSLKTIQMIAAKQENKYLQPWGTYCFWILHSFLWYNKINIWNGAYFAQPLLTRRLPACCSGTPCWLWWGPHVSRSCEQSLLNAAMSRKLLTHMKWNTGYDNNFNCYKLFNMWNKLKCRFNFNNK